MARARLLPILLLLPLGLFAQKQKLRLPVWTFHARNTTTIGLNVGLASIVPDSAHHVTTIGVHAEVIGLGVFLFMAPTTASALKEADYEAIMAAPPSEQIHGLLLSPLGSVCACRVNGISLNGGGVYNQQVNGIALALAIAESDRFNGLQGGIFNFTYHGTGLQVGIAMNHAVEMYGVQFAGGNISRYHRGVQIGIYNKSENFKGLQIGIWNVNQVRKWPLFNWA